MEKKRTEEKKSYYLRNREYILEQRRKYREKHKTIPGKRNEYYKEYRRKNKEIIKEKNKARRKKYYGDLKWRARKDLENAINRKEILKPSKCSNCKNTNKEARIEGHHEDYSKPLVVLWLCTGCHRQADMTLKTKGVII